MNSQDHYAILGVLPDAEAVVITAAYRALIQRYHPDRWSGDKAFAHQKTVAINEAYRVLSDPTLRAMYDETATKSRCTSFEEAETAEGDRAFNAAMAEIDDRWAVACSVYPDLRGHRARLGKISSSLAFAFVVAVLERKTFANRAKIASELERSFLTRYFGNNPKVLNYALSLVLEGHRDAALALNQLVRVMGSEVEPSRLFENIERRFKIKKGKEKAAEDARRRRSTIKQAQEKAAAAARRREDSEPLMRDVRENKNFNSARQLARLHGYDVTTEIKGFFRVRTMMRVTSSVGMVQSFDSSVDFIDWVRNTLCGSDVG
jgi:curved DNA-binding protein CbpA